METSSSNNPSLLSPNWINPPEKPDYIPNRIGEYQPRYLVLEKGNTLILQCQEKCVIKALKITSQKTREDALNEFYIMKELSHTNCLEAYDFKENEEFCFILMQQAKSDLLDDLNNGIILVENTIRNIMRQLFSAVAYIHNLNIVHCDIKLENIFTFHPDESKIDPNIKCVLGDFGLARKLTQGQKLKGPTGTVNYQAPEILYSKQCMFFFFDNHLKRGFFSSFHLILFHFLKT